MNFSTEELVDMTFIIGESQRNCLLASRLYAERYPNRRHPQVCSFSRLLERFVASGNVKYKPVCQQKDVTNEDNQFQVLQAVVEKPSVSQRTISAQLGVSQRSVGRILKQNKFHPYKIQLSQELLPLDYNKRKEFCRWGVRMMQNEGQGFLQNILWSDEATFHNNGRVNRHNFHYYSDNNPNIIYETHRQHRWSLNVWAGIVGTTIIGPYFFDGPLNGAMYRDFLLNQLGGLLDDVPLMSRRDM